MTRRLNIVLAVLILLVGVPFYWLLLDNRPGDVPPKPITVAQLRVLAAQMPGPHPTEAQFRMVAFRRVPGDFLVAGWGLKRRLVGVMGWTLPVPGGRPIAIDTGFTADAAAAMSMESFDTGQQRMLDQGLRDAGLILVTHEHVDHLGGFVALAGAPAVARKVALNAAQLPPGQWSSRLAWPKGPTIEPRIRGDAPQAVAPGVVAIPAPSHTPGSQMIFVTLADGRELLFAGDISSFAANWRRLRARSRLVGEWIAPENRREVYAWLKTIRAWKIEYPALVVIPGHDYEYLRNHAFAGLRDLTPPAPNQDALASGQDF